MNKSITGRHFELTDAIKAYAEALLEGFKKYNLDIISGSVVISADERNGKKGFSVEILVNLKDKNTIVITEHNKDVYAALDLGAERVKKSLRRHADKIKDHKVNSFADLGEEAEAVTEIDAEDICTNRLILMKPLKHSKRIKSASSSYLTTMTATCVSCTKELTESSASIDIGQTVRNCAPYTPFPTLSFAYATIDSSSAISSHLNFCPL